MSEHCSRYEDMAVELCNSLPAFVFSHDHQGHGRSEGDRVMVYCYAIILLFLI